MPEQPQEQSMTFSDFIALIKKFLSAPQNVMNQAANPTFNNNSLPQPTSQSSRPVQYEASLDEIRRRNEETARRALQDKLKPLPDDELTKKLQRR